MSLTLGQITEEAMRLSAASRAELVEKLIKTLDFPENDELRSAWSAEAIRRRDEVRSGIVKPMPGEEVVEEIRRLVGR